MTEEQNAYYRSHFGESVANSLTLLTDGVEAKVSAIPDAATREVVSCMLVVLERLVLGYQASRIRQLTERVDSLEKEIAKRA